MVQYVLYTSPEGHTFFYVQVAFFTIILLKGVVIERVKVQMLRNGVTARIKKGGEVAAGIEKEGGVVVGIEEEGRVTAEIEKGGEAVAGTEIGGGVEAGTETGGVTGVKGKGGEAEAGMDF